MKRFALTGGIASGKSTVADLLRRQAIPVVDADQIARQIVRPDEPAYNEIVTYFGKDILEPSGEINRKALGKKVFSEPGARAELERITHPRIFEASRQAFDNLEKAGEAHVVYEAALIFEVASESLYDATLLVVAAPEQQVQRIIKRDRLSSVDAWARLKAQMPLAEKIKRATVLIDNSGSVQQTAESLRTAWKFLTGIDRQFA